MDDVLQSDYMPLESLSIYKDFIECSCNGASLFPELESINFLYEFNLLESESETAHDACMVKETIEENSFSDVCELPCDDNAEVILGGNKEIETVRKAFGTSIVPIIELSQAEIKKSLRRIKIESSKISKFIKQSDFAFYPNKIGLVPFEFFSKYGNRPITITQFVTEFLQTRMSKNTRFQFKLFNILRLTLLYPDLAEPFGAKWVNDHIIKIEKTAFASALGIKTIDGSLFHRQGNFPCHGFVECKKIDDNKYVVAGKGRKLSKEVYYFTHPTFSCALRQIDLIRGMLKYKNDFKKNYNCNKMSQYE